MRLLALFMAAFTSAGSVLMLWAAYMAPPGALAPMASRADMWLPFAVIAPAYLILLFKE